jgi:purine-nucleoside phosphorylase
MKSPKRMHREYVTYTGIYKGIPISVMAMGLVKAIWKSP